MLSGDTGDVTNVTDVTFSNNQASGGGSPDGGGIGNAYGTLNITNSTFTNNQSVGSGGGLYFLGDVSGVNLTVNGSTFTNNVSTGGDAGAIKTTSGTSSTGYTISNSTFTGNKAEGPAATGGAVDNESGTLTIDHSTFVNNQVTMSGGRGGAVGSPDGGGQNVTITFSRFVGNTAATATNGNVLYGGSGSTMTANDNWWGINTGPATHDRAGTTTVSDFLMMTNTASPNPIEVNQTTTLTDSFLFDSASNAMTPSDLSVLIGLPVTWGSAVKGTLSGQQTSVQSNGTATANFTANTAGAGSAIATVDSGTATASITINPADTTTSLSSATPDPSVTGQTVTISFSVSSTTGSSPTAPTGTVTVSDGTQNCTGTLATGSCTITFTSAGSKSLTATYNNDSNFNTSASSPATSHTVNLADTTPSITSDNPDPSEVGQVVTVQYSVAVNPPGSGTPTGNVTVSDGTDSCSDTVAAGQCLLTITSAGAKSLTATYAGDSNFNGSTSGIEAHTVNQATPILTTTASGPVIAGDAITDTAHLSGGYGTLSGTVTYDVYAPGDTSCTTALTPAPTSATVSGAADYISGPFTTTTYGDYRWIAHYSGDSNNAALDTGCGDAGETSTAVAIDAVDDSGATINSASGGTSVSNVLANDTLNGATATPGSVTLTVVGTWPTGITLNTGTGEVTVAPGTTPNTYTPQYQICDQANPTLCDTATVTVPVVAPPDLQVGVTDDTGGNGTIAVLFNWKMTATNTGAFGATFPDGDTILSAPLPAGPTYGSPSTGSFTAITNSANIQCSISSNLLTCTASGADVTIGATTGSFSVTFGVTPAATGNLSTTATVDPSDVILESDETNNTGSDTVAVTTSTAVLMSYFKADKVSAHQVELSWETLNEINMWGFNVYRSQQENTGFTKLNATLIQAQNFGSLTGSQYQFSDQTAQPGTTYYYRLEIVRPDLSTFVASQTTLPGIYIYLPSIQLKH